MLLAGKYFIIGCIKSPVLHWDRSTEDFRWLEWAFGEALGVEDAYFCHLLWRYMVILSTSSSWSSHLSLCRMTQNFFSLCWRNWAASPMPAKQVAISLAPLAVPQEILHPCTAYCSLDPEILLIFVLFLEGSMFVYYILHFVCV